MKTTIYALIITLLLLIIFALGYTYINVFSRGVKSSESFDGIAINEKSNKHNIPKKIWSYWHDTNLPKFVQICIQSWKKYNPDYEIVVLNKDAVKQYVHIPENINNHPNFNDSIQRYTDLVRLYVLEEHGGVWLDASILMKKPLDVIFEKKPGDFYAYYIDEFTENKNYPVIENWFFACEKGCPFVNAWKEEFLRLKDYENVTEYVKDTTKTVDKQKILWPEYLAMHVSAQKVLQIDKYPLDKLVLYRAEDEPLYYFEKSGWDYEKSVQMTCDESDKINVPFLKFVNPQRNIIESEIDGKYSNEKCNWIV